MSEFTFEPGQLVLVREDDYKAWLLRHFSHRSGSYYHTTSGAIWLICIPFNDDTKHLIGTNKPYTPPVDEATRFKRGELVEVEENGDWVDAVYLSYTGKEKNGHRVFVVNNEWTATQPPHEIRKKQTTYA